MIKGKQNISFVVQEGLCTGCGTCVSLCPASAIEMQIDQHKGIYIPLLDEEKCTKCGLCVKVCPGHEVDFNQLNQEIFGKQPDDILLGNYLNCYTGHAADYDIRYNTSSGGLVTALLIFALEQKMIDGALVTRMKKNKPLEPEPFIARTREEIIEASCSKYCPVPANVALREILQSKDGEKFAVVGLPCHLQGIRKAEIVNKKLKEKIILHVGIVCSHSDSFFMTELILNRNRIKKNDINKLDYRGHGWPGQMKIILKNGRQLSIPYEDYIAFHALYYFTPHRCVLCGDFINRFADIVFMDAWLPEIRGQEQAGESIVVVRRESSNNIFMNTQKQAIIELEQIVGEDVIRSQGKSRQSNTDLKVHYFFSRLRGKSNPNYNFDIPHSRPVNYARSLIKEFNIWISGKHYFRSFINPIVKIQSYIFRLFRATT